MPSTDDRIMTHVVRTPLVGPAALALCDRLAPAQLAAVQTLVLHVGGATEIDASGVAALVRAHGQLAVAGKSLRLVEVQPAVRAALVRLGLDVLIGMEAAAPADLWPQQLATHRA